ncbi:MAG: PAS domain S-box protein, partial [candidate division KSB1 bacterium]|nr:PAS domain S-box protein [candidate division KSB1 bacterium]
MKDESLFPKRENGRDLARANGAIWNALLPGEAPSSGEAARHFFDNLGIPIAILDRDLNFVYGNHAFSEMFEFFPDLSSGRCRFPTMFRRLNHDGFESWWAEIQWFDYRQFDGIFEFAAADGLPRVYKVIFSRQEDGAYYTATFINITAEERQRNHLRKRLGHARSLLAWLTQLGQARDEQTLFQKFCTIAKDDWRIQSAVWIRLDGASQRLYIQFEWKNGEIVVEHANHPWNDRLLSWLQETPLFRVCPLEELHANGLDGCWIPDGVSHAVVLPLRRDGHLRGLIVAVGGDSLDAVAPEEIRIIAERLQVTLEHVQQFEENCRFRKFLQHGLDGRHPSVALYSDPNILADRIGQQLCELTACRAAAIVMFEDEALVLKRAAGLDVEPEAVLPEWQPEQWESRMRDGQPLVLTGIADSPEFSESSRRLFQEMRVGTLAAIAAREDDDRLVVVAGFFDDPPPDAFTLDLFATQALYGVRAVASALMIRALKHSRDFMEGILKHSAYAIICTDRYGRITYYSQGAKQMLGYSEDEVIGHEVSEFWFENPAQIRKMLNNIGEHDRILDYETYLKHQNGQYIPFSLSLAALYDDSGRISG